MGSRDEFNSRYDSYRPGDQNQRRSISEYRNNNRTEISYRRDYNDDGRERYPSDSASIRDRERVRSPPPVRILPSKPHRRRNSSFNPAPVGLDTINSSARSGDPNKESPSAIVTPSSPALSISIPLHNQRSRLNSTATNQNSRLNNQTTSRAEPVNVQQKSPPSRAMSEGEIAPSPTHFTVEEDSEAQSQSWSIKQLIHVISARDRKKVEYETHRLRCETLKEELKNAKKLFSHNNPYVEKIQGDLKATEDATLAKKEEMRHLTKKEKFALDSLESFQKNTDALVAGLSSMKTELIEEKDRSRKLGLSNDDLHKQITELRDVFKNFGNQINQCEQPLVPSKLYEQIQVLENTITEDATSRANLFIQFEKDKAEIAKLRDELKQMSDSQVSLSALTLRVDHLEAQPSAVPQPAEDASSYLTMKDLYPFITQYNDSEIKNEARFEKLENASSLTASNLSKYATADALEKHITKVEENSNRMIDMDTRLAAINTLSQKLDNDVKSVLERAVRWDENSVTTTQPEQDIISRVEALETAQQNPTWFTNTNGQSLQQEARNLRSTVQDLVQKHQQSITSLQANLDRISQAHSHSISSLNQRFNNLHTDQLARHILSILDPSLVTIKPDIDKLKKQVEEIQKAHEHSQVQQTLFSKSLETNHAQIGELKTIADDVKKSSASHDTRIASFEEQVNNITRIGQEQTALIAVVSTIQENIAKDIVARETAMDMMKAELNTSMKDFASSMRTEIDQNIEKSRVTQRAVTEAEVRHQGEYQELLNEVTQARDDIEGRLVGVKTTMEAHAIKLRKLESLQHERGQVTTSPTVIRKVDPDISLAESSKTATARSLKNVNGGSPQAKASSTSALREPSLAKHFQSRRESNDDSDTIDITPAARRRVSTKLTSSDIFEILDSDQEQDHTENGDEDSDQEPAYLSIWTNRNKEATVNRAAQSTTPSTLNGAHGSPKPSEKRSVSKRKRESSSQTSKGGKGNGGSRSNTPHSSSTVRKKPKT